MTHTLRTLSSFLATLATLASLTFAAPALAADAMPYNVLSQDKAVVTDLRADAGNVWIKLASNHLDSAVTVRISDRNRDFYRPWFNGDVDLVSRGFRGNDVWSDRVQTEAKFIEYWLNDVLVLHLERK